MAKKLGRTEKDTPLWWRRYNILIGEGFVPDEASLFAEGMISTPAMKKGRRARQEFYKKALAQGLSAADYIDAVDELYDSEDWFDEYSQFYVEKE